MAAKPRKKKTTKKAKTRTTKAGSGSRSTKKTTKRASARSKAKSSGRKTKKVAKKKPTPKKASTKKTGAKKITASRTARKGTHKKARAPGAKGASAPDERDQRAKALKAGQDHLRSAALLEDLEFRNGIDITTLDLVFTEGKLTVRGIVSDEDELESIREIVMDASPGNVEWFVQIAPSRREEDRDQAQAVQEVFDQDSSLCNENIQVACYVEKVVLRGTVSSSLKKYMAGILAMREGGVVRIRNRLVVR